MNLFAEISARASIPSDFIGVVGVDPTAKPPLPAATQWRILLHLISWPGVGIIVYHLF